MPLKVDRLITDQLTVGGTSITGSSGLQSVSVDGVTIVGDGTLTSPLTAVTSTVPYKVYIARLTQSATNPPNATVFENTLGNLVWSRGGIGYYEAVLADVFPNLDKVRITLSTQPYPLNSLSEFYNGIATFGTGLNDNDTLYLYTGWTNTSGDRTTSDDVLGLIGVWIEIRVYD